MAHGRLQHQDRPSSSSLTPTIFPLITALPFHLSLTRSSALAINKQIIGAFDLEKIQFSHKSSDSYSYSWRKIVIYATRSKLVLLVLFPLLPIKRSRFLWMILCNALLIREVSCKVDEYNTPTSLESWDTLDSLLPLLFLTKLLVLSTHLPTVGKVYVKCYR